MRMPVLFIGHGNPMNAIERNEFHLGWAAVASRLPRPTAILCVSAHWETRGAHVTAAATACDDPRFLRLPAGAVRRSLSRARRSGARRARCVARRQRARRPRPGPGARPRRLERAHRDVPAADVPVVQLSMDTRLPGSHHYALARQLAPLRDEGVLVLGSGNIVHNLRLFDFRDPAPLDWALAADAEIRGHIAAGRHDELAAYPARPEARLAVPTPSTTCRCCTRLHCSNPVKLPNSSTSTCRDRSR